MTRQQYNKEILNELSKLIDKYPDQRFGQLIIFYHLIDKMIYFFEESEKTFKNIRWILKSNR